jgi:hypothetical protein
MTDIIIDTNGFELSKFREDSTYHQSVQELLALGIEPLDLLHQNTAYAGKVSIARKLSFYELYKQVLPCAGHIAEVGVWKGAVFLYFAKLVEIFEPQSNTLVHGFDNFMGMKPSEAEKAQIEEGCYKADYETLRKAINIQKLDHVAKLHKLDVTTDLGKFFNTYRGSQFKLVFLDAGVYSVLKACIPAFWERMVPGGIMVFDQFNYELSFGESNAVREFLPDQKIHSIPWTRSPSGYVIKE